MKVQILTTICGPNIRHLPGEEVELSDNFAKELIIGGYAKATEEQEKTEIKEEKIKKLGASKTRVASVDPKNG
jgi:hypothetical protein